MQLFSKRNTHMREITLTFILAVSVLGIPAQSLSVSVTGSVNTDCIGQGCFYNGPTILINEVMLSPSSRDGSIMDDGTSRSGEWIELYNPHKCDSVDISCYFLGNNAPDGGNYGGGFVIPPGSVVPPQGFALVRGRYAAAVPDSMLVENGGNVVEIIVDSRYCYGGGTRLWFPNAGGWFAFYDANGIPQDAISWCSTTNSCMSCTPCNPGVSDCGFQGIPPSYDAIPAANKNYITSLNPQNYLGQSFRRIPDGGVWQSTPSSPTYATCNADCIDPPIITCNAIAVATATGGTPPYSYVWNDPNMQTTDTAIGLCAGTHTVTVTDFDGNIAIDSVVIVDYEPPVSHPSSTFCLNDSSAQLIGGMPLGGTYSYNNTTYNETNFNFNDSAAVYQLAYTIADSNGCIATADFTITVNPDYDLVFYDTICQREPYSGYGFTFTPAQTSTIGTLADSAHLQTPNHCDSIVTLYLTVLPSEIFTHDTIICEGIDFQAFGFEFSAEELTIGPQTFTHVFTNTYGCDSTEILNLTVGEIYDIHLEDNICKGSNYNDNGFIFNTDTMELGEHVMVHNEQSSLGCDSVVTLTIHVLPVSTETYTDTICQYEDYTLHGFNISGDATALTGEFSHFQNLTNIYGCDSIIELNLVVTSSPQVDFLLNPERALLSQGTPIEFINLTDISGTYLGETFTWNWDFGDGNSESTIEYNVAHTYDSWGEFLVTLSITSSFGCTSSVSHYAYVDADLEFPNVLTPNGDNLNDVFAIKNLNPHMPNMLTVYNRWGKKVYEKENYQTYALDGVIYNAESGFTAEGLSDGVYYYVFHYEGYVHAVDYHSSLTIIK